jgi:GNAT superfamily N-acetyltransferase
MDNQMTTSSHIYARASQYHGHHDTIRLQNSGTHGAKISGAIRLFNNKVPASVELPARSTLSDSETMILNDPAQKEDAWLIAVDEAKAGSLNVGAFVGLSHLGPNEPAPKRLVTCLTDVQRNYRRRGIATALEACAIEFTRDIGAYTLKVGNEDN